MYRKTQLPCYILLLFSLVLASCSSNNQIEEPFPPVVSTEEEIVVKGVRAVAPRNKYRKKNPRQNATQPPTPQQEYQQIVKDYWTPQRHHQIFRAYGVNPTILSSAKNVSTFALDVDDGAYKLAINMLENNRMPQPEGIRVEEFINALEYQYQESIEDFGLSAELMPSPFRPDYHVLHLGVQTKRVSDTERLPANLVLVADVSGSMADENKIALLKTALTTLIAQLRKDDRVAIVAYQNTARLVLPPTSANNKRKIATAIASLKAGGGTNVSSGLQLAYTVAGNMYQPGFINRVILTSDGMANVGATMPEQILHQVSGQRRNGIFLTTVGVGLGMYNDALLEQLSNQGDGHYLYFADGKDIQSAFVDRLTSQLQTVAKNAKAQIHFNPEAVSHYRLLGYENRGLNTEDFLDTEKDGGEIGAGQRVTALYEVKLIARPATEELTKSELASFSIAYQKPAGTQLNIIEKSVPSSVIRATIDSSSSDLRLSAATAAFAEKLRKSHWSDLYSYDDILHVLETLPRSVNRRESIRTLHSAVKKAARLDQRGKSTRDVIGNNGFNLDHVPLLQ